MDFSNIKEQIRGMKFFWIILGLIVIAPPIIGVWAKIRPQDFDDRIYQTHVPSHIEYIATEGNHAYGYNDCGVCHSYKHEGKTAKTNVPTSNRDGDSGQSQNWLYMGGFILAPLTLLDEEGLRIQKEKGCGVSSCHTKK